MIIRSKHLHRAQSSVINHTGFLPVRRDDSILSSNLRDVIYTTTIIGGTFILALVVWLLYRRRRHRRKIRKLRLQEELAATSRPRKRPPGHVEPEMAIARPDVAISRHSYTALPILPTWYEGSAETPLPTALTERFRRKDAYIKATLGEAYPMHMRNLSSEEQSRLLADIGSSRPPTPPPKALIVTPPSIDECLSPKQADWPLEQSERSLSSIRTAADKRRKRPEPLKLDPDEAEHPERWSWTNSQAPATPRMYAPTLHSSYSRYSGTRLRMAVNWVRTRGERIVSGEYAEAAPSRTILPKPGVLKNQASKPNLAPKKLVKKASVRKPDNVMSDIGKGSECR